MPAFLHNVRIYCEEPHSIIYFDSALAEVRLPMLFLLTHGPEFTEFDSMSTYVDRSDVVYCAIFSPCQAVLSKVMHNTDSLMACMPECAKRVEGHRLDQGSVFLKLVTMCVEFTFKVAATALLNA